MIITIHLQIIKWIVIGVVIWYTIIIRLCVGGKAREWEKNKVTNGTFKYWRIQSWAVFEVDKESGR